MSSKGADKWLHAFVTSRLDCCNSKLSGSSSKSLNRAACVLTRTRKRDHISPVLASVHWFLVVIITYNPWSAVTTVTDSWSWIINSTRLLPSSLFDIFFCTNTKNIDTHLHFSYVLCFSRYLLHFRPSLSKWCVFVSSQLSQDSRHITRVLCSINTSHYQTRFPGSHSPI